jgi:VanZ family protein
MKNVLKYHWRAILWVVFIFVICLLPGDNLPNVSSFMKRLPKVIADNFDKILHFGMYFILSLFLLAGFTRQYGKTSFKAYFASFMIAFCCGVLIEFIQSYVGRSGDVYDVAANTAGILTAIGFYHPIKWVLHNIL